MGSKGGCSVETCEEKHYAKGYCRHHYSCNGLSVDERKRKPLRSDNLELTGLTPSQEANLIGIARSLPGRKSLEKE